MVSLRVANFMRGISLDERELTVTVRCFELGALMGLGRSFTPVQVQQEFGLSHSGAWRLLQRVCGSRRVAVTEIDGAYMVADGLPAEDWPY